MEVCVIRKNGVWMYLVMYHSEIQRPRRRLGYVVAVASCSGLSLVAFRYCVCGREGGRMLRRILGIQWDFGAELGL